jgi:CHAT domain-containing protein
MGTIRRALIGNDGIVLEFSEGESKSYLWAITDSDVHCYFLPGRDSLDRLAREFTSEIADGKQSNGPEQTLRASRELGRLLLRPLSEHPGRNRLLVVADGALAVAPLAAVQVPDSATGDFKYLIDSYEILMLPSVQSAIALRARAARHRPRIDGVAVFADAVYGPDDERVRGARTKPSGGSGLPRLAFSKAEAEDILAIQPSKSNLKALGFDARPDAVRKAAGYRYLHFSVHAMTDAQHPEASSLVLSTVDPKGDARDGLLRLDGILDMPLRADLVVLSGCDTGTGREIRAEGIVGLTQAFLYAGAREAMSSFWPVNEFNTRELMKRFYAMLLKSGKTPSAALRDAQLSMKSTKAWEAPSAWAGFQVYGVSQ